MQKKVLIVDDDIANIKYLSTVLRENGFEAIDAQDGVEGMQKAESENPDVIVLDVMMPRKTGFGMFKSLKKNESLSKIPVIMLTSIQKVIEDGRSGEGDNPTFEEVKDHFLDKMEKVVDQHRGKSDSDKVRPEVFMDKPIDPDEFIKAVSGLAGVD